MSKDLEIKLNEEKNNSDKSSVYRQLTHREQLEWYKEFLMKRKKEINEELKLTKQKLELLKEEEKNNAR